MNDIPTTTRVFIFWPKGEGRKCPGAPYMEFGWFHQGDLSLRRGELVTPTFEVRTRLSAVDKTFEVKSIRNEFSNNGADLPISKVVTVVLEPVAVVDFPVGHPDQAEEFVTLEAYFVAGGEIND